VTVVGTVPGVQPGGEGGLLGLAVPPGPRPSYVLAYLTSATDNRVLRIGWDGGRLGASRAILTGIPKSAIHNGGRLRFGPDGMVYVATGDAGEGSRAQDPRDLGGKILRITPEGRPAPGNPDPASRVWSLGHRNVQGLAFDRDGRLWATEFGQSDADELNLIRPGANYGWPQCEGACGRDGFVDPAVQWSPTAIASPSGLAIKGRSAYVASLRGEVLYRVRLDGETAGEPRRLSLGDRGRLRTVETGPRGRLWLVTGNTDGRGTPRPGDDTILRLRVT
jgi:glucose/arabinose dehydrogenase